MFIAQMIKLSDKSNLINVLLAVNGDSPAEASAEVLLSQASEVR
ncbi:hypothetical protein Lpp221_13664 [Lacticaseibacillus paracasei subsp. paracasei Lpp221]|jgi:hypothetical protein|nr:hypothetical protein Lpp221_13664 [Lacticaseibacillus paracasei subsp. paracasei Lpp221]